MKYLRIFILAALLSFIAPSHPIYAAGEGNIDHGGGSMGQGTSTNKWTPGDEGVRVTVVRMEDYAVVATPIDLTNKRLSGIGHFNKVSKLQYTTGAALSPSMSGYTCARPEQALPKIISSQSLGQASIEEIKSYFTDEQVIRSIAGYIGMDFNSLINGDYRLLIEPIAYVTFQGAKIAMTATEAALYDEQTGGAVRSVLPTVAFQNLPLSMFLESPDLGYPAWDGPTSGVRTNHEVKTALGLGIVRFNERPPEPPVVDTYDYVYRVNTEVITAVDVSGGQSDPDHPVSVTFHIGGRSYRVNDIYYPSGDSQLAWVRWTTPSVPQTMTIHVSVSGGGRSDKGIITANIIDLGKNPPPDPQADDRNDMFRPSSVPVGESKTTAQWCVWRPWWYEHWVWHSGDDDDDGYWCDHARLVSEQSA